MPPTGDHRSDSADSIIIRQRIGLTIDVIRCRIPHKPYRIDMAVAQQQRLADPVHAIHHPPRAVENNRIGEIRCHDELAVLDHAAHRGAGAVMAIPVHPVDLGNLAERHRLHRQIAAQ